MTDDVPFSFTNTETRMKSGGIADRTQMIDVTVYKRVALWVGFRNREAISYVARIMNLRFLGYTDLHDEL